MFEYKPDKTNEYAVNHPQNVKPRHNTEWFSTTSDNVFFALFIFIDIVLKLTLASCQSWDPAVAVLFFAEMMP